MPDTPRQSTSDHGWDLAGDAERLLPVIRRLKELGCRVSLFMDPKPEHMELAEAARRRSDRAVHRAVRRGVRARATRTPPSRTPRRRSGASKSGLGVNAGHDLNLRQPAAVPQAASRSVLEVSIGHALIGDALEFGLPETVRKYLARVRRSLSIAQPPTIAAMSHRVESAAC